jgi:hypothetical protein
MEGNVMGGVCGTCRGEDKCIQFFCFGYDIPLCCCNWMIPKHSNQTQPLLLRKQFCCYKNSLRVSNSKAIIRRSCYKNRQTKAGLKLEALAILFMPCFVTGRRGIRRKQLQVYLKEMRGYWKLKEEALDRTSWRTGIWRGLWICKTDYIMNVISGYSGKRYVLWLHVSVRKQLFSSHLKTVSQIVRIQNALC